MSVLEEVNKHRNDIVTDTYSATWREVLSQYKDGDLKIDPEYQRLFRWDTDQQTQYLESVLLNIPSPPLFLARNEDGKFEVIDGLQRISTMVKFFAAEIFGSAPPPADIAEELENTLIVPSVLAEGPLVPSLEGYTAATLPEPLVRTIKYARITIILLEKESSVRARYHVFRRLNKLGSPLSDQEIRNCTGRLFGKEFPSALRTLASEVPVREALALTEEEEKRMGVEEKLLRLLAFNYSDKSLKHEVSEYLDEFMVFASEGKFKLTAEIAGRVTSTFLLIRDALPDGKAFRFARGGFSTNLFDVVAIGVFRNLEALSIERFRERHSAILESAELKQLVGPGSNTRKKFAGRLELATNWFK